jgi:predicted glycoside hydrolase/deacetylase ChbG (UPF0249 family)
MAATAPLYVADDFGLAPEVDQAIRELALRGRVDAVSVLATTGRRLEVQPLLERGVELGLHFDLTCGRPLCAATEVPSLLDERGRFLSLPRLMARALGRAIRAEEVCRELDAQWEYLQQLCLGLHHLDGHQHVHLLVSVFPAVLGWLRGVRPPGDRLRLRFPCRVSGAGAARGLALVATTTWHRFWMPRNDPPFVFRAHLCDYGSRVRPGPAAEVMMHPALPGNGSRFDGSYPLSERVEQYRRRLAEPC